MVKISKSAFRTRSKIISSFSLAFDHQKSRDVVQVTGPSGSMQKGREPNNWEILYHDKKRKLVCARADKDSDFVSLGDLVFMLIFKDGRKIRWEKGDLTERVLREIIKSMKDRKSTR